MNYKMHLTPEEEEILNGGKGETMAKVMKTLVMYGDAFGATKMVPVTSKMGAPCYKLRSRSHAACL